MTQREIAEMLRSPQGAYFADNTPAMLALETMVDTAGLRNVLYALAKVCDYKAEHLRSNWQDQPAAKLWDKLSNKLHKTAASVTTP